MPLATYTDESQAEYLFTDDTLTAEALRGQLKIPDAVEVIDSTKWRH